MPLFAFFQQPLAQLIVSAVILGLGALFVVFIDLGAIAIAFYRLLLGGLLFGSILFIRREPLAISSKALFFAVLAGIFFGLDLAFWNMSILLIGPGVATILNSLQIFFMASFGILFYRDMPSFTLFLSLIITFIGVVLLSAHEVQAAQGGAFGVSAGIFSAFAFAASMLCLREAAKYQQNSLINTMFYASLAGSVAIGLWGYFAGETFITNDIPSWVMIAVYGSVVHVLAWFLMAKSIPHVSVAIAGLIMCLEPLTVFAIDLSFLDKSVTFWQSIGVLLTLTAVYVGSQSAKRQRKK